MTQDKSDEFISIENTNFLASFASEYNFINGFNIHEESNKSNLFNIYKTNKRKLDDTIQNINQNINIIDKDEIKIQKEWSKFSLNNQIDNDLNIKFSKFIDDNFGISLIRNVEDESASSLRFFTTLTYDTCPNGCTVYVGENANKTICPNLKCEAERYYHCSRPDCRMKSYNNMCKQHPQLRKSKSTVNYRSIEKLLSELLQESSFIDILNYRDMNDSSNFDKPSSTEYEQSTYKRNMEEMHENFETFLRNYNPDEFENINISDVIEISLCISWFFDSFQIYHRKVSIFAPLIFTILNLPPNIRNIMGFGTFLLSFLTFAGGSNVEKFVLFDCFIGELLMFQDGVNFITTDPQGNKKLYRVQMRATTHILDMSALCKELNVESVFGSKFGCVFCNQGPGYYDELVKKTKYFGTGRCLGPRSYFNSFATSQQCCPYDWYYDKKEKSKLEISAEASLIEEFIDKTVKDCSKKSKLESNDQDKNREVKAIVGHTGSSYADLKLKIKYVNVKQPKEELWHESIWLRDLEIVKDYISNHSELLPLIDKNKKEKMTQSKDDSNKDKIDEVEAVKGHTGKTYNDLILQIKYKKLKEIKNEKWHENFWLRDSIIVEKYMRIIA